jgi:cystathionine gamma-synthase
MAAYLLLRGMKTLQLRVQQLSQSALKIARYLATHQAVEEIFYPGLESHPQHEIARNQMSAFGGVLSFMVKGEFEAVRRFLPRLKYMA